MPIKHLPASLKYGESSTLLIAILSTFETQSERFNEYWNNYSKISDPMQCDEATLDFIATLPINPWRILWNPDWDTQTKRLLLRDANEIFSKRLFVSTVKLLFSHFELLARVVPMSGLIVGVSLLPERIGTGIYDYKIVIPGSYQPGTTERALTEFIITNFGFPSIPVIEYQN
ncbi:hypothetical protein [Chroococcidiopsis sp.]|uniref:hypothetical protein n=1 Tax=Chroococcidiopsis sp. TaxID=3088168 RepID=UPI003F3A31CE